MKNILKKKYLIKTVGDKMRYEKIKLKTNMIKQFVGEYNPSCLNDEPVRPGFRNYKQLHSCSV